VPADRGRGHVLRADDALRVLHQDDEVVDLVVEVGVLEGGVGERAERGAVRRKPPSRLKAVSGRRSGLPTITPRVPKSSERFGSRA